MNNRFIKVLVGLILFALGILLGLLIGITIVSQKQESINQTPNNTQNTNDNTVNTPSDNTETNIQKPTPEIEDSSVDPVVEFETQIEDLIGANLNMRGDAFLWIDLETPMSVLQTTDQYTALEAAQLQDKLATYFDSIDAEVNATLSTQSSEKASYNKLVATKGDAKYTVGFVGTGSDGAFYIAFEGLE